MNYCMQEIYEVHPAAGSNCYMQSTDYYAYFEDSPGYSGCDAQAVPSNNIYMEQAWAVNQPYTCSYPGNMFKSKDSDLDMALSQRLHLMLLYTLLKQEPTHTATPALKEDGK